ncbi:MAG: 23S rRNA (adenine(2503)-C(2))-methyltransferase RlmN [Deltaproteobacteria bacterium]|nr:23S rRNA (adenine(2503)-C(2))-methyltransferase RlmN [Deltaproteobacteria bacterium]
MINLLDLNQNEIHNLLDDKPYRSSQVFQWIYKKAITDINQMTNIAKNMRTKLAEKATIVYPELIERQVSEDTTEKYAYRLNDGNVIESVLIPDKDHWTICVSSQVGCSLGCKFCYTGRMGFVRNLMPSEIIAQVLYPMRAFPQKNIRNVVFMGMGEPLLNYDSVVRAVQIITDVKGPGISTRRVTVSSCGIIPGLKTLWRDTHAALAISLNAPTDQQRSAIMPINTKYPLNDLLGVLREYPLPRRRRITMEYVLLKGVNDSLEDARNLVRVLSGIKAKINLIPFNQWPGAPFQTPDKASVEAFEAYLKSSPLTVMMRREKGQDILAACGQLAGGRVNEQSRTC